jgi:hypothetical protein
MKALLACIAVFACILTACNTTGLSKAPRATFSQIACLDKNGDNAVNAQDATDPEQLPDFNADDERDDLDAAFLYGLEIPLDPNAEVCNEESDDVPEYAVAHGYFSSSDVSCDDPDSQAVLLVGVGGGVVNIREREDAAGIREIIDALQQELDERDVQTIGVLAGPLITGAANPHAAMEDWLTHAIRIYLERYDCLRVVIAGHSHGGVTADVVASRLEDQYADRFIAAVEVDRIDALYVGNTHERPDVVPVFNAYETNDDTFKGAPHDSPNYANWDASGETAPSDGDQGGDDEPVRHTTIDNSEAVRARIVDEVIARL